MGGVGESREWGTVRVGIWAGVGWIGKGLG